MKIVALIPARAGSKRLAHKNRLMINGKTLVEHAIEQAIGSRYINEIIISSDDPEVLHDTYHKKWIVFESRPSRLCRDDTGTDEVIAYVMKKHKADVLVLLQPTSPVRYSRDIDRCISFLIDGDFDSVITLRREHQYLFSPNGNIFVVRKGNNTYSDNMGCLVLDEKKSVDIDTDLDYQMAKLVLEAKE